MRQELAPVLFNEHLTGEYWLIEVKAPEIARDLVPGQFVNIRIEGSLSPFLRRPFSVYRTNKDRGTLQVAYKVIGEGTRLMKSTMPTGGRCDVVGPFGKGFTLPPNAKRVAMIGRGIGIAALPALLEEAVGKGIQVHGFLSARTADNLVAVDIFEEHGCPVTTHNDVDQPGVKVTDHLDELIATEQIDAFYVCGSNRLAYVTDLLARKLGVPAEIAMEQHMACGFGDCHGCVIDVNLDRDATQKALREVCHHGPVFNTWEVVNV
jgi:dihydroorotate dehydrogenase electron transfer subunit